jgi:hypothetical protein
MHRSSAYDNRLTRRPHVSISPGEDRREKVRAMLFDFLEGTADTQSFRECYVRITGDKNVTGKLSDCNQHIMRESLGDTQLAYTLGDAMNRRMVADYRNEDQFDVWRAIASIGRFDDFRTVHRTRFGGYGDLSTVAKGQAYPALVSPSDEEVTYAPFKKGGTEGITLENIKNDDVGVIRAVPKKLSKVAKRTLAKFVLDFIKTNPVIYDGLSLFDAGHNNLGGAALSAAAVAAGRIAMHTQVERDSNDRLPISPRSLLVPFDLEETGNNIFRRNTNNDKTFVQNLSLDVLAVWYWTDVTDWALAADPADVESIEVGFLDGNQEPELFVQDNPSSGSMFSNDQLTWKIRHIYGGVVKDYRGLYKSIVSG